MLWILRRPRQKEREREREEGAVNPDLLSEHQRRNKASAATQIPQVHCPINAITTAPRLRI